MVWERLGFASVDTCESHLFGAFRREGYELRDRIEATRMASRRHGLAPKHGPRPGYGTYKRRVLRAQADRPQCAGVRKQPPRKGERCRRRAMAGSEHCFSHDPTRAAERERVLAEMQARQPVKQMVAIGPFAAWLRRRYAEHGTLGAMGAATGLHPSAVWRYKRGMGTSRTGDRISAELVRQAVERDGGTTFEELYGDGARGDGCR